MRRTALFAIISASLVFISMIAFSGTAAVSTAVPSDPRIGATSAAADRRGTDSRLPPLRLSFAGDLMAHPPNFRMSDYGRIYDAVEQVFHNDDLSFINLEFVVDPSRPMAGYPRFNVHRDYVLAAVEAGFDVFAFANNHITDYGTEGIRATRLQQHLISWYAARGAGRPLYFSGVRTVAGDGMDITEIIHEGWRIGYLSVTGILNHYYDGADLVYLVPYWNDDANESLRDLIRRESPRYDLFILAYHGGTEYWLEPNDGKWRLFNSLMDAGVDILWGHHPHVLQPIEFYPRGDGRYGALMYSLGNFVSSQPSNLSPDDGSRRRAYTGDSVISRIEVVMTPTGADVRRIDPLAITHLREYATEDPQRDGFEVHLTADAPGLAREEWKPFYHTRADEMSRLIGPASARYYQKTHPMP
jgi:poly-gamma-glutamate capsule biosynthesis protein CapA/YwtB (metallophosphatase superfamily)